MKRPRYPLLWLMLAVIAIKAGLFAWGVWVAYHATGMPHNWLSIWDHGDAAAYKLIAAQGYFPDGVSDLQRAYIQRFPPLYPIVIGGLAHGLGISMVFSGVAIALGSSIIASYLLYRLAILDGLTELQAASAVLLFSLFPTSFVTNAVYAEGFFLLCVTGMFVAMRRDRFILAGLAGAAAILTRVIGVALLPAVLMDFFWRFRRGLMRQRAIWMLILPLAGLVGYLVMNAHLFGSPVQFYHAFTSPPYPMIRQRPLRETFVQLWDFLGTALDWNLTGRYMLVSGWNALFTLGCLGTVLWGMRYKFRSDLVAYGVSYVLLYACFRQNFSHPRYTFAVIPMFLALAQISQIWAQVAIALVFAPLLLYFTGIFINGGWPF